MFFRGRDRLKCAKKCGILVLTGVLLFAALCFSGCGSSASGGVGRSTVFTIEKVSCPREDAKVILLQFQKEYSSIYGIDAWSSSRVDQSALASYVKNGAVSQLAWVYSLDIVGENMGIVVSEDEAELAKEAAKTYLDSLDEEVKSYLGAGESDLQQLFERYLVAKKTYAEIVANVSTEVSDDEALVIDMQVICVSDQAQAENLLSRIEDGDDFTALAQTYSEGSDTALALARTTFDETVTDLLFALNEGEHSGVLEIDGKYYIFYCENYFNENLTEENKENVLSVRRQNAVKESCEALASPADSSLNNNVWSKVEVDTTLDLSAPSFREVFEMYFS